MAKTIRLNEAQLHRLISETVSRILKEDMSSDPFVVLGIDKDKAIDNFCDQIVRYYQVGCSQDELSDPEYGTDDFEEDEIIYKNDELGLFAYIEAKGTADLNCNNEPATYDHPGDNSIDINNIEIEHAEIGISKFGNKPLPAEYESFVGYVQDVTEQMNETINGWY